MKINIVLENIIDIICSFVKIYFISIFTLYLSNRIINESNHSKIVKSVLIVLIILIDMMYVGLRYKVGFLYSTMVLILLLSIILSKISSKSIAFSILIIIISFSLNNVLYLTAVMLGYIISGIINIQHLVFGVSVSIYIIMACLFLRIKRFKHGFVFLQKKTDNDYFNILFLNISVIILFSIILLINSTKINISKIGISILIFAIVMYITIQKSLQLYYKQDLLIKELEETKKELANKTKEVEDLEAENLSFSKKSHSLAHKQKSLEYKLQEIMNKTEISAEEAAEVKSELKKIETKLYEEKTTIELDKTGITEIDDMLKYMQSECVKNKIEFELQLKGNIHHMTNNFIAKEDLEILLADHIKDAIIAINHTDNINRSILVRLGNIDDVYSLYIYDSGVEFKPEVLDNLGKKPCTTHADEGGTGMGFMNTFDTLRKYKASLIIEEYNEPSKDNYTKAIIIKFDKKNEFKIQSYRTKVLQ